MDPRRRGFVGSCQWYHESAYNSVIGGQYLGTSNGGRTRSIQKVSPGLQSQSKEGSFDNQIIDLGLCHGLHLRDDRPSGNLEDSGTEVQSKNQNDSIAGNSRVYDSEDDGGRP